MFVYLFLCLMLCFHLTTLKLQTLRPESLLCWDPSHGLSTILGINLSTVLREPQPQAMQDLYAPIISDSTSLLKWYFQTSYSNIFLCFDSVFTLDKNLGAPYASNCFSVVFILNSVLIFTIKKYVMLHPRNVHCICYFMPVGIELITILMWSFGSWVKNYYYGYTKTP